MKLQQKATPKACPVIEASTVSHSKTRPKHEARQAARKCSTPEQRQMPEACAQQIKHLEVEQS